MSDEPLLSLDETDALLEAMRASAGDEEDYQSADLGSPDRALREALGKADRVAETLANAVRRLLLRAHGISSETEENPPEIIPFNVLAGAIQNASAIAMLTAPGQSTGIVIVGPAMTAFVCERRLGAPLMLGMDTNPAPPRNELTAVDRRVIQVFINEVAEELSDAWAGQPNAIKPGRVLGRAADIPPLSQFEPMLRLGIRCAPNGGPVDEIVVALTAGAARAGSIADQREDTTITASAAERGQMAGSVAFSDVELSSVLGGLKSSVADLLTFEEGDIIRLNTVPGDLLDVKVNGITKLRGTPAITHGNLSIEVKEAV